MLRRSLLWRFSMTLCLALFPGYALATPPERPLSLDPPQPGAMTVYQINNPNSTVLYVRHQFGNDLGFSWQFYENVSPNGSVVYHVRDMPVIPSPFQGWVNLDADLPFTAEVIGYDYPTPTSTPTVTRTPTVTPTPVPTATWAFNAGGPTYGAWTADQAYVVGGAGYVGGNEFTLTSPIANTTDDVLYQSERWGLTAYRFSVPNGQYAVELRFAEIYWTESNRRVFDVAINGVPVLTNYDIYARVGANAADDHVFNVNVTNGLISVDFTSRIENTKLSAIRVWPLVTTATPTPTRTPTVTPTPTAVVPRRQLLFDLWK